MSKREKILVIALVAVIVLSGGLLAYAYRDQIPYLHTDEVETTGNNEDVSDIPVVEGTGTTAATGSTATTGTTAIIPVTDTGVTWQAPEKLANLGLIKETKNTGEPSDGEGVYEVSGYYKVASIDGGGSVVLAAALPDAPGGAYLLRFRKSGSKYYYLTKHSDITNFSEASKFLVSGVEADTTTQYQSISAPDTLTVSGTALKTASSSGLFSELKSPAEVAATNHGKLYRVKMSESDTEVGGVNFSLKLADSTYANYSIKFPFMGDSKASSVTWSDGTKVTDKFTPEGFSKCGLVRSDNTVLNTTNITSRLTQAGSVSGGDTVYIGTADDEITKAVYENYKTGRSSDVLSITAFTAKKPYFVWKSGLGTYVIFTSTDYAGLAECGKPVIYLYPEKETQVSVKVGATITKSEPNYGTGWNVLAKPDGTLSLNGENFPYLFWEGQGQSYPRIDTGFVVKQAEIKSTLIGHLAKLGLNQKETSDFMEFWLPKMPATPYVRLTWFGTQEMNQLAPLTISPKPDTAIRIFLDFAGLSQPIDIQPQRLSAPARKGFTLVEWGGLLHGEN